MTRTMKDVMAYCPECREKRWFEIAEENMRVCERCNNKYSISKLIEYSQDDTKYRRD